MKRENEVIPGSIHRIEIDGVFDGYVRLIEPDGQQLSEMASDFSQVVVARRWLVEFVSPEEVPDKLSRKNRMTQFNQKGRRTHRIIRFAAGNFYEVHTRYSGAGERVNEDNIPDTLIDKFVGNSF